MASVGGRCRGGGKHKDSLSLFESVAISDVPGGKLRPAIIAGKQGYTNTHTHTQALVSAFWHVFMYAYVYVRGQSSVCRHAIEYGVKPTEIVELSIKVRASTHTCTCICVRIRAGVCEKRCRGIWAQPLKCSPSTHQQRQKGTHAYSNVTVTAVAKATEAHTPYTYRGSKQTSLTNGMTL